ncbi:MAG: phosphonate ABC transporter, permease protein PhnE [Actinomycetota bacterium]|nr:phosphonate ABC transporter, permease protein PhnE [Actinomycetota bacterium]
MTTTSEQGARSREVTAPGVGSRTAGAPPGPSRRPLERWGVASLVVLLVVWSVTGTGVGPGSLIAGREEGLRLLRGFLRPDLSPEFLAYVARAGVQTLQISLAGLALGVLAGLPLAALLARNVAASAAVRAAVRVVATILRGVPELLWALVFVATVGLGPAAGVYAIALHGAGLLAKLCAEQLEAVDPAPVEALQLSGAPRSATAVFAIFPQARAGVVSLVLYQWECNIRTATVVGFVGAGGIGQALDISLRLFRYQELSTLVLAVLALILVVDAVSRAVRRRLGAAA